MVNNNMEYIMGQVRLQLSHTSYYNTVRENLTMHCSITVHSNQGRPTKRLIPDLDYVYLAVMIISDIIQCED